MFSYFEPNFIELKNSIGKVVFQIFCSHDFFCETKIRFLAAILKRNIFFIFIF